MPSGSRNERDNGPNYVGTRDDLPFWAGAACPLNPTTRFLGAEIEVGNGTSWDAAVKIETAVEKWKALVHNDCAFELCTAPASGHLWVEQVMEFCQLFKEGKITASHSNCGCHVHIDARDLSPGMVEGLLHLLIRVEPIVFAMVPTARRTNSYCNPGAPLFVTWLDTLTKDPHLDRTQWLLECIFGRDQDGTIKYIKPKDLAGLKANKTKHCGNIPRYLAFNLQPYFGHGTIECRVLNGCTNPVRLIGVRIDTDAPPAHTVGRCMD